MARSKLKRLLARMVPSGDVVESTVKSGLWVLSQNAVGRVIQLVMLVILARLIGPAQVGLIGIVLLTLSALKQFTNLGFNAALVQQREENVDGHLSTAWVLMGARGAIIALSMVLAAPFVATLFGEPETTAMIRVLAVSPLVLGLKNPGVVYFQKNLEFHKQFVYRISGEVLQFVIAVGYALVWPTAWAFVVAYVVSNVFRALVSYLIHDYRPRLSFDRDVAADLVGYGKWLTGTSILYFLYSEGDDAFVGWFLGPAALGFYQYAYRLSNAPATELTQVVSSVMFPTFSKMQDDLSVLRDAFLKTIRINALVAFPVSFGIVVVAPDFVRTFLGTEWTPMIPVMQILAMYGMMRAFTKVFGSVWKAVGRPDYVTKLSAVRVVLIALLIFPLTQRFGTVGTAGLITGLYVFPMVPLDIYVMKREIGTGYGDILGEAVYPFVAGLLMAGGVWAVRSTLALSPPFSLALSVLVGAALYLGLMGLFESLFDVGIKQNVDLVRSSFSD
jgi:PST family polysaccharide transporter/lipopolysaccharide exporter